MSDNRIKKYFDDGSKKTLIDRDKKRLQELMERVAQLGNEFYDLLDPGLTIELDLPSKENILVPNQRPNMRKLLITRPQMHLTIQVPRGEV